MMRRRLNIMPAVLFVVIAAAYVVMVTRYPTAYIYATHEGLFGEWVLFWLMLIVFASSVRSGSVRPRYRAFFILLAIISFIVAMEEISWGQRLIGFSSPLFFRTHNLEGQTNLRDLLAAAMSKSLKETVQYIFAAGLLVYGVLYPVANRLRLRVASWFDELGLAAPPVSVTPFFLTAAVLELGLLKLNEAKAAEVFIGSALVIMTVYYAARRPVAGDGGGCEDSAPRLDRRIVAVFALVFALTSGTIFAVDATAAGHKAITRRLTRGIEKFAGRYSRIEQWPIAAELYLKIRTLKPDNPSTLRGLANCYLHMGRKDEFDCYIREALSIDLDRLAKNPGAASVNRSLVRTYRLLDEDDKAAFHLKRAMEIGVERVQEHPNSGTAAYSLGKTYSLMERYDIAYKQFARAVELDSESRKYRRALYRSAAESKR